MVGLDGNCASAGSLCLDLRAARSRLTTDQSFGLRLTRRFKADLAFAILANGRPELRERLREFRAAQSAKVLGETLP